MSAKFSAGKNIAMKVPSHQYEATVRFYSDILGFERVTGPSGNATGFKFGDKNLWIDNVPGMSQAEIWLEVVTNNTDEAARVLEKAGIARCDEIENLGEKFDGFWISSPSSIIHLIDAQSGSWE